MISSSQRRRLALSEGGRKKKREVVKGGKVEREIGTLYRSTGVGVRTDGIGVGEHWCFAELVDNNYVSNIVWTAVGEQERLGNDDRG